MPSWPLLLLVGAFALVMGVMPTDALLRDPDTFWHVAAGRWMLAQQAMPVADPFSFSRPGAPWVAHEWLSEVVMAWVFDHSGWRGLVALGAACFAATLALAARFTLKRVEPIYALMLVALSAILMSVHLLARPHVLVWPCMALWLTSLLDRVEAQRAPDWRLLPVMALWANLHGSFILGLLLCGFAALEAVVVAPRAQRRATVLQWLPFGLASVLAAILTPHGWHGLVFPLELMSMSYSLNVIGEWLSPTFRGAHPLEMVLLALLAAGLLGRLRLPWVRLCLLLLLVHLALKHQRNIAVLGLLGPLLLAQAVGLGRQVSHKVSQDVAWLDSAFLRLAQPASGWAFGVWLSCGLAAVLAFPRAFEPGSSVNPVAAVDAALRARPAGPVLNAYNFGGYLIYRGVPVFIDGRADMYGDNFVKKEHEGLRLTTTSGLQKLLDEYRIGWTLLPPDLPANALLAVLPDWKLLHADEQAVVYVRRQVTTGGSSVRP